MNWYNSIYPEVSNRTLVYWDDIIPEDAKDICKEIEKTVDTAQWFLLAEDLHALIIMLSKSWISGPTQKFPSGGFPANVWVGTQVLTQEEVDKRLPLLMQLRARRLFVLAFDHHDHDLGLDRYLANWRCSNCGVRGKTPRPEKCPTGTLCVGEKLDPQIHWLIDELASIFLREQCKTFGVSYWDGVEHLEVPL